MKLSKKELEARVQELESQLASKQERIEELEADNDYMCEEYYSEDAVQDLICDAIRDHEAEQLRDLQRYEPEIHRQRFQLIHGGAA